MTAADTGLPVRRDADVAVIGITGDVDRRAERRLDVAWDEATAEPVAVVVLDFAPAGYINSTGIALIVGILAKARARGIAIRASGLTPHYREIFEITRLADFMAIDPDEPTAVRGDERSTT